MYAFIQKHADQDPVRRLCRMMAVHSSGYYALCRNRFSDRARDDQRLLGLIKHARRIQREGLSSQIGYWRCTGHYGRKPAVVSSNYLNRRFDVKAPNVAWVTDITFIRTYEGWLYLTVVIDLFFRQVVGWSMKPRMTTDLALNALLAAVWLRKPQKLVMVHSDRAVIQPHGLAELSKGQSPGWQHEPFG